MGIPIFFVGLIIGEPMEDLVEFFLLIGKTY